MPNESYINIFLNTLDSYLIEEKRACVGERAPIGIGSAAASPLSSLERVPLKNCSTLCKGARDLDKAGAPKKANHHPFLYPLG